jgi:uncharacterized membrane protein YdbT with pleckstrin-like domain
MSAVKVPVGFSLLEGERPVWSGRRSWKSQWPLILIGMLIILIGIFLSVYSIIMYYRISSAPLTMFPVSNLFLLGALGSIISSLIFGGLPLILAYLSVISTEYFVTNKRIYIKYGIIRRTAFELRNEWITSYTVAQGIIGRMLNYGHVIISTPGYYTGTAMMKDVSDPMHVRTILEENLRKAKEIKEVEEKLRKLEEEHDLGRISYEKYAELKRKYEEEMKRFL